MKVRVEFHPYEPYRRILDETSYEEFRLKDDQYISPASNEVLNQKVTKLLQKAKISDEYDPSLTHVDGLYYVELVFLNGWMYRLSSDRKKVKRFFDFNLYIEEAHQKWTERLRPLMEDKEFKGPIDFKHSLEAIEDRALAVSAFKIQIDACWKEDRIELSLIKWRYREGSILGKVCTLYDTN